MLAGFLRFLLAFLNVEASELHLLLVHPPESFGYINGCAASCRRLVLIRLPIFIQVFFRILPADAIVFFGFSVSLPSPGHLTQVGDRHSFEVVVFDDDVIPLGDITVFIDGSGAERPSFEDALCVAGLIYLSRYVCKGQSAGRKHPCAVAVGGFAFGILAFFLHTGTIRTGGGRGRVEDDAELLGKVFEGFIILHVLRRHQIGKRVFSFHGRADPALEHIFRRGYAQLVLTFAHRAVANVVFPLPA